MTKTLHVCPVCKKDFARRKHGACPNCGTPITLFNSSIVIPTKDFSQLEDILTDFFQDLNNSRRKLNKPMVLITPTKRKIEMNFLISLYTQVVSSVEFDKTIDPIQLLKDTLKEIFIHPTWWRTYISDWRGLRPISGKIFDSALNNAFESMMLLERNKKTDETLDKYLAQNDNLDGGLLF